MRSGILIQIKQAAIKLDKARNMTSIAGESTEVVARIVPHPARRREEQN
jgi:hypothetical protein